MKSPEKVKKEPFCDAHCQLLSYYNICREVRVLDVAKIQLTLFLFLFQCKNFNECAVNIFIIT